MSNVAIESPSDTLVLKKADVESFAKKLGAFHDQLQPNEKELFGWLMERAGYPPLQVPKSFHYRPRGAKHLVIGGADGVLVTISRSGVHVTPPIGPLPDITGMALIPPER